jgi:HTH-type transcriptional regulator/antitoxin HigA
MNLQKKEKRRYAYTPDYAVAPGETLGEVLASLCIPLKTLAEQTGLTEQTIERILKGIHPITFETAIKLDSVTGVPARMWNNLELQYRKQLSKTNQGNLR